MDNCLDVYINRSKAGQLWLDDLGRMGFQYDSGWLSHPESHHLSVSLPLREVPFEKDAPYPYFTNLLPEGNVLSALAGRLGIAETDKFGLLKAIGGDCAGAVSLYPEGVEPPDPDAYDYEFLTPGGLQHKIQELNNNPFLAADEKRLSLAGAMEKLPVCFRDGRICLPLNSAPTTHILKPPVETLQGIVTNEAYCMTLAKGMGLDVPKVQIIRINEMPVYLIERYDRVEKDGHIIRLVQEDFCQVLNLVPQQKYDLSFGQCFDAIRTHCANPIQESRKMLSLILFNGLIGNSDGHAKNISLLHDEGGTRLAPFYDLVSTHYYGSRFTRKMPVKLAGKKRDFRHLEKRHFAMLAEEIQMKPATIFDAVEKMARDITGVAEEAGRAFKKRYKSVDLVDRVNALIRSHAEAMLDIL